MKIVQATWSKDNIYVHLIVSSIDGTNWLRSIFIGITWDKYQRYSMDSIDSRCFANGSTIILNNSYQRESSVFHIVILFCTKLFLSIVSLYGIHTWDLRHLLRGISVLYGVARVFLIIRSMPMMYFWSNKSRNLLF